MGEIERDEVYQLEDTKADAKTEPQPARGQYTTNTDRAMYLADVSV